MENNNKNKAKNKSSLPEEEAGKYLPSIPLEPPTAEKKKHIPMEKKNTHVNYAKNIR